ncbi:nuclease HARBI1 [Carex littledalei]|uniref:Nuclease HARBI1 n=1 Tax=Carex littledalei TaxID=544730 RepID=A0A833VW49_9POAL|nr:nuclease HARBI1 [Carex littledalei]
MRTPSGNNDTTASFTDDVFSYYISLLDSNSNSTELSPLPPFSDSMPRRKHRTTDEDSNPDPNPSTNPNSNPVADNQGKKKNKKRSIARLLTSLAALDAQDESDRHDTDESGRRDLSLLESNHQQKTEAMLDYYSSMEEHFDQLDESDTIRAKRARLAATAAVTTVVAAASVSENSAEPASGGTHHRRLWVKDRSTAWWDLCNSPDYPENEFRAQFRMGRATFDMICDELRSVVARENTMLRAAIPVEQRVAVCIWRLATGEPLRLVSKRFGLGISTCHKLVLEVCSAIKTVLMPKFLQWPTDVDAISSMKSKFESISGIPNVIGSMYTTHIPIIAPKISVAAYFNRRHTERNQKTSYSITLQGVVDPTGAFTDVCIGWPGSMPDDQVMEKSALYQRATAGMLTDTWVVGGNSYPLMDWVLVPYDHQNLTWTQHAFNEKIGELTRIAKEAFTQLKSRWSCLQKRTEVKLQDLPVVLGACCVLHNICQMRGEEMEPKIRCELVDDETVPENPVRSHTAKQERDSIAHNLLHRGYAGTGFFS